MEFHIDLNKIVYTRQYIYGGDSTIHSKGSGVSGEHKKSRQRLRTVVD